MPRTGTSTKAKKPIPSPVAEIATKPAPLPGAEPPPEVAAAAGVLELANGSQVRFDVQPGDPLRAYTPPEQLTAADLRPGGFIGVVTSIQSTPAPPPPDAELVPQRIVPRLLAVVDYFDSSGLRLGAFIGGLTDPSAGDFDPADDRVTLAVADPRVATVDGRGTWLWRHGVPRSNDGQPGTWSWPVHP